MTDNKLCTPEDRVLLAVSGGVDSMVMLHLFLTAGYSPAVAHCNFGLRREAQEEQEHVEAVCRKHNIPIYSRKFDTKAYAGEMGVSIQIAARDLRYQFFTEVMKDEGYNYIATAHHALDNLETILLNLVRGTGMDGMTGIPLKNGAIIRPLLFASRNDIHQYALEQNITWKEDASNLEDNYSRNLIRNNVIPWLRRINPSLDQSVLPTIRRFRAAKHFSDQALTSFKEIALSVTGDKIYLDTSKLQAMEFPEVILWESIKEFGFSFDQCERIVKDHQSGKQFFTRSHLLTIDRDRYIIQPSGGSDFPAMTIDETSSSVRVVDQMLSIQDQSPADFVLNPDKQIAQLDKDRVTFPITWRKWKEGDYFFPLGMRQRKKVSDFLIDLKISRVEKETITVLESAGEIIWVVGLRISDHVKITNVTSRILVITHQPSGNDSK